MKHLILAAALFVPTLFFPTRCLAEVRADNAWMRQLPPGVVTTAAYVDLTSTEPDRLVGAQADIAKRVEVHETTMTDGVMSMRHIPQVELPKDVTVSLKPKSKHLMVMNMSRIPQKDEVIPITLTFEKAGKVTVNFVVR